MIISFHIRYKFDDERVTKEDNKRALEEQYGGEEEVYALTAHLICVMLWFLLLLLQLPQTNPGFNNTPFKFTKYSNAYMLVYIRESDKDKIICDVGEKDIAEHLRVWLSKVSMQEIDILYLSFSSPCFCSILDKVEERTRRKGGQETIQSTGPPVYNHQGHFQMV